MANRWNSVAAAVSELGEATVLKLLNQKAANDAYRKNYQADRNAAYKAAKQDPRFKQILAEQKAARQAASPAAPILRKAAK